MGLLNLSNARTRNPALPVEDIMSGQCYVGIAVELDNDFRTSYTIKIGMTRPNTARSPLERCDEQRVKMIGYAKNTAVMGDLYIGGKQLRGRCNNKLRCISSGDLEKYLKALATRRGYIRPNYGYSPVGGSEMRGDFATIEQALEVAEELLQAIRDLEGSDNARRVFTYDKTTKEYC
mgnify:CR=1 FL=1